MKQKLIILIIGLFLSLTSFGQDKIYYDADWKVCSKSKADYYRLISFDENEKPKGKVKDYFITGELQWEGYFSYVDKYDNSKDINEGLCIWYYQNGRKQRESNLIQNKENGLTTFWHENGNKSREVEYTMGELDGDWVDYYESGKIKRKYLFSNGELVGKFFTECDEFGSCQKVFYETFSNSENINNWSLIENKKDYESKIIEEKGLIMKTKTDQGFRETIRIPLDLENNFSIETIIDFKGGSKNNGHGLMWGYKDWDNYYYFYISANGYYRIGAKTEGINLKFAEWTETKIINQNYERNLIKILRVKDKMYFSINGSVVHSEDFYSFRGNQIGFSISSGEKEILFENLIVKQDIDNNLVTSNNQNISNNSDWKGNGTGFFIDKNGYIATNYHVVEDAKDIEIEFIRNGIKQTYSAEVIQSDKQNDLSIIKINSSEFKPFLKLPFNFKTNISDVGSNIFALGYPMALSLMGTEIKFTDGKISSKTGMQGDITSYQISVPIQPGNSGGPLFDYDGNLIGITTSTINRKYDITENVNYAVKSSYLKNLIDVLDYKLTLPNDKLIANKTLTEKIKILSDYVVLIKIR
jgi:S1-C subfamily serine protease/antitoxin component YwqK of YwqJK toxin-antitoxin module